MNLCCTETLHTGTGKLPRFHPVCLRQKTILIHVMITESPCRIEAAPRWYSVSRNIRIFTPYRSLSEMTGQLTVLFNTFIIIFTLQRLFYIKIRMSVKPETASKRRKHLPCCKFCLCKLNLNTKWCFLFLYLFFPPPKKLFPVTITYFFLLFSESTTATANIASKLTVAQPIGITVSPVSTALSLSSSSFG